MAKSISASDIMAELPKLNPNDLTKLRQLTELLLGSQTQQTETQATDDNERILFEAVRFELQAVGMRSAISYSSLQQSRNYKTWKRSVSVVTHFLDSAFKGHANTEVERLALCRIFVQAMIKDFKRAEIPVSLGTLCNNLHRVQQAFDRAFPNYLESGLAHLIPKALTRSRSR